MRQVFTLAVFMLAMVVWTMAQQPGTNAGQGASPSSQTPSAGQSQPSAPGSTDQGSAQTPGQSSTQAPGQASPGQASPGQGSAGQGSAQTGAAPTGDAATGTVTEGCLGGSNPNFTLTDKAGTTYKLNFPQNTDVSVLNSHVGESVQVLGQPASGSSAGKASAIDVSRIGRGAGNCQASSSKQPKS